MTALIRLYFKASGNVQGIGFRWFVRDLAKVLFLTGWVRNVRDGSVEGEVQGPNDKIKIFLSDLKTKHHWADVDRIETREVSNKKELDFLIRLTL